jgi:hypothetical protein
MANTKDGITTTTDRSAGIPHRVDGQDHLEDQVN